MSTQPLFPDFDFRVLDKSFSEAAVREELINPILKRLGYTACGKNRILYEKKLSHPTVKIGSGTRDIVIIPDYLLEVNGKYSWVLDAKSPNENITTGENVEQAYFYAIHPDIRTDIYALCNGREFVAYSKEQREPLLFCHLSEIEKHWDKIENLLSPDAFSQQQILHRPVGSREYNPNFSYSDLPLPKTLEIVKKRKAQRHFGVHGYFTKQSWDILQHYIKHFSQPGDTILDPFAGSGITAIEAMMIERKGINIDLNPLAIFLVENLTIPVNLDRLGQEYEKITKTFQRNCPNTKKKIKDALKKYPYPTCTIGMKGADVETVDKLFSDKQLAQLAYLKYLIKRVKNKPIQGTLMLMFSGLLTKANLTYHISSYVKKPGGGDASAFRYYRYRIAPEPTEIDILKYFDLRYKKVVKAKKEMEGFITKENFDNLQIIQGSATRLKSVPDESVDYIYTDPPYGSKIPYLDLSVMWNAWLDLPVTEDDRQLEAIEGGRLDKTRDEYVNLLADSIKEMFRVLKFDRWLSFVFAHKDPHYWHIIVDAAERCGFEYVGAVKQTNGQTSFKKRQNPFSVLSGQLIINFQKKKTPKAIQKFRLGNDVYDLVIETIENVIAENNGATLEQINDELILKGLELGFLDILSKEYKDLTPVLMNEFDFDEGTECFFIRKEQKFKTKVPLDKRIRYFLTSYLKRKQTEGISPTTDNIILDIIPLLRNGITPQAQTVLNVLKTIATHKASDCWELYEASEDGRLSLS